MLKALSRLLQISLCTFGYLYTTNNRALAEARKGLPASAALGEETSPSFLAQVTSDETVNTQVNQIGNSAEITGGETRGSNLFHSFQDFSVGTGNQAFFNNAIDVGNIFSRVTGGNVSNINGAIRANGGANLFLINPAGIIFGANAQLDVGGSFVATTADRVIFADQVEFKAIAPQAKSILTISSPVGLQYGGGAEIEVLPNTERSPNNPINGLNIKPGNTLAFLGGDVSVAANDLSAIGGNIEIGSVKYGTVGLEFDDDGWQFDYHSVKELGQIEFRDRARQFFEDVGVVLDDGGIRSPAIESSPLLQSPCQNQPRPLP